MDYFRFRAQSLVLFCVVLGVSSACGPFSQEVLRERQNKDFSSRARVPPTLTPRAPAVPPASVLVIPLAGQSNADGVGGNDIQTTVPSVDFTACQTGAVNVIEPIDADSPSNCLSNRERPSGGVAYGIRQRIYHVPAIIIVPCGAGGTRIQQWDPAAPPNYYTACQQKIAAVATEVANDPMRFGSDGTIHIPFVGFWQGEANYTTRPSDATDYAIAMSALRAGFDADAKALTAQTADVLMFTEVPSSFSSPTAVVNPPASVVGQVIACADDPLIHCVNSAAAFRGELTRPWLHKLGEGHRLSGELMAAAAYAAVWGAGWNDFAIESASATQSTLTVCWDVPQPPLQLSTQPTLYSLGQGAATYGCPAHPNGQYGLEVNDASGAVSLSAIQIVGSHCIEALLSRSLAADAVVRVNWTATSGPTQGFGCQGSSQNPFTNIADSSQAPAHFFALPSRMPLTVVP